MDNLWITCGWNCGICKVIDQCEGYQRLIHRLSTGYPQVEQLSLESGHEQLELPLFRDIRVDQGETKEPKKNTHSLHRDRKQNWRGSGSENNNAGD